MGVFNILSPLFNFPLRELGHLNLHSSFCLFCPQKQKKTQICSLLSIPTLGLVSVWCKGGSRGWREIPHTRCLQISPGSPHLITVWCLTDQLRFLWNVGLLLQEFWLSVLVGKALKHFHYKLNCVIITASLKGLKEIKIDLLRGTQPSKSRGRCKQI